MTPKIRPAYTLPASTGQSDDGPIVEIGPSDVTVTYDADGGESWVTVRFELALAVRFTREYLVEPWMVESYSRICELQDSDWLRGLALAADMTGCGLDVYTPIREARHLFVYFDDHGCVEVAARGATVSRKRRPAPG